MKKFTFSFLLALILFVPLRSQQADSLMNLDRLLDSLENIMEDRGMPGLMLTLIRDDSVIYSGGLGYANMEEEIAVNDQHLFRLGSITKSFVSLALIKLQREGKIDLNQPLKEVAPEVNFINPWSETHPLRVRHIIEHTAGFNDMELHTMYNREERELNALELVRNMEGSLECRWEPGSRFAYSNPGYLVAAFLVEKYGRMPFEQYIRENIFEPLGMKMSNITPFPDRISEQFALPYRKEGDEFTRIPLYAVHAGGAGNLNSNAAEMSLFLKMFLNNGWMDSTQLYTEAEITDMETPKTSLAAREGLKLGYGMANYTSNNDGKVIMHGHDGGIDGFASSYAYNREHGLAYAVSNSGAKGLGDIVKTVLAFLSQDLPEPEAPVESLSEESREEVKGYYKYVSSRNEIAKFIDVLLGGRRLVVKKDSLYSKFFMENPKKLIYCGDRHYRHEDMNYPPFLIFDNPGRQKVFSYRGNMYLRSSFVLVLILQIMVLGSLGILLTLVPAFLVWTVMLLIRRMKMALYRKILWPVLAIASSAGAFFLLNAIFSDLYTHSQVSWATVLFFIATLLFAAFSLITLGIAFFRRSNIRSRFVRIYYIFLAAALFILTVYLTASGVIGLKLWVN